MNLLDNDRIPTHLQSCAQVARALAQTWLPADVEVYETIIDYNNVYSMSFSRGMGDLQRRSMATSSHRNTGKIYSITEFVDKVVQAINFVLDRDCDYDPRNP